MGGAIVADSEVLTEWRECLIKGGFVRMSAGGADLVELVQDGREAVLRVFDHGPGISESDAQRVFDRFFRSDEARATGESGFGLGLAIALQTVQAHRGTIHVESEPGRGTTMTMRLPVTA